MEEPVDVYCPWCGESFTTFVDVSAGTQQYTEDCQVCCKPIVMNISIDDDGQVVVQSDRE